MELLVELWGSKGSNPKQAFYSDFSLSDDGKFRLKLGKFSGNAGDALSYSRSFLNKILKKLLIKS